MVTGGGEQLGVLGVGQQAELGELDYLSSKTGGELEALRRLRVGEDFGTPAAVPHEADADGPVFEIDSGREGH
ncbi:hypothetical protein D9M68_955010 [compost metagenome]